MGRLMGKPSSEADERVVVPRSATRHRFCTLPPGFRSCCQRVQQTAAASIIRIGVVGSRRNGAMDRESAAAWSPPPTRT